MAIGAVGDRSLLGSDRRTP